MNGIRRQKALELSANSTKLKAPYDQTSGLRSACMQAKLDAYHDERFRHLEPKLLPWSAEQSILDVNLQLKSHTAFSTCLPIFWHADFENLQKGLPSPRTSKSTQVVYCCIHDRTEILSSPQWRLLHLACGLVDLETWVDIIFHARNLDQIEAYRAVSGQSRRSACY